MPVIHDNHGWYTDEELSQLMGTATDAPNSTDWWDAIFEPGRYTGTGHHEYFAAVAELLPSAGRWCDVGCGIGEFLAYARRARPNLEAWGFDLSPAAIDHARRRGIDEERLAVGSLPANLPWPTVPFDVATVLEVVEHFPLTAARQMIASAVSIAPRTILTVPNGLDFASGHFVWYDLGLFRSMVPECYQVKGELLPNNRHWIFTVER